MENNVSIISEYFKSKLNDILNKYILIIQDFNLKSIVEDVMKEYKDGNNLEYCDKSPNQISYETMLILIKLNSILKSLINSDKIQQYIKENKISYCTEVETIKYYGDFKLSEESFSDLDSSLIIEDIKKFYSREKFNNDLIELFNFTADVCININNDNELYKIFEDYINIVIALFSIHYLKENYIEYEIDRSKLIEVLEEIYKLFNIKDVEINYTETTYNDEYKYNLNKILNNGLIGDIKSDDNEWILNLLGTIINDYKIIYSKKDNNNIRIKGIFNDLELDSILYYKDNSNLLSFSTNKELGKNKEIDIQFVFKLQDNYIYDFYIYSSGYFKIGKYEDLALNYSEISGLLRYSITLNDRKLEFGKDDIVEILFDDLKGYNISNIKGDYYIIDDTLLSPIIDIDKYNIINDRLYYNKNRELLINIRDINSNIYDYIKDSLKKYLEIEIESVYEFPIRILEIFGILNDSSNIKTKFERCDTLSSKLCKSMSNEGKFLINKDNKNKEKIINNINRYDQIYGKCLNNNDMISWS